MLVKLREALNLAGINVMVLIFDGVIAEVGPGGAVAVSEVLARFEQTHGMGVKMSVFD